MSAPLFIILLNKSGLGRECDKYGLVECVNANNVAIKKALVRVLQLP
jgi:hypothetical protein